MKVKLTQHNSDTQLTYGGHGFKDSRKYLEEDTEYEAIIEEHDWHTFIYIDGRGFNSVCFEVLETEQENRT